MIKNHKLLAIFFAAMVLRLYFVFSAYHGDLNNNISWGTAAVHSGLSGLYERKDWPYSPPNQPPLTILLFALLRLIWESVENTAWWANNNLKWFPSTFIWFWEDRGMKLLVKLPSIAGDFGMAVLIYQYFKRLNRKDLGLKLSSLWLFNPISWFNSSIWGQTDSIVNSLGYWGIAHLLTGNVVWFLPLYTLSLLFKGSLAIFAPVLVTLMFLKRPKAREWLKTMVITTGIITAVSVWFHPSLNLPFWLLDLYKNRIFPGEIGYLTANAFNFWWLIDNGKTLDNKVYLFLTARSWGILISCVGIIATCVWIKQKLSDKRVFYGLALAALVTFLFMTRIHERYLYPFFPAATFLVGLSPITSFIYLFLSVAHLLNIYHLFQAAQFAPLEIVYKFTWLPEFLAVANIATLILMFIYPRFKKV